MGLACLSFSHTSPECLVPTPQTADSSLAFSLISLQDNRTSQTYIEGSEDRSIHIEGPHNSKPMPMEIDMDSNFSVLTSCKKPPKASEKPTTVHELKEWIKKRSPTKSQATDDQQNLGCSQCFVTAKDHKMLKHGHSALQLSHDLEQCLRWGVNSPTADQQIARADFRHLVRDSDQNSVLSRLGRATTSSMTHGEVEYVLRLLYRSFFPPGTWAGSMKFKFKFLSAKEKDLGSALIVGDVAHIKIHPSCFTPVKDKYMPRAYRHITHAAMGRLNTLLHEIIHEFIELYACPKCPTYKQYVKDLRGHGHAWQQIAYWVEYAAPHIIGLPLKLGRFEAIKANWKSFKYLPSLQELDIWELVDED